MEYLVISNVKTPKALQNGLKYQILKCRIKILFGNLEFVDIGLEGHKVTINL